MKKSQPFRKEEPEWDWTFLNGDWGIAVGIAKDVDWEVATTAVDVEDAVGVGVGRTVIVGRAIETIGIVGRGIAALIIGVLLVNFGFRKAEKGILIPALTIETIDPDPDPDP